MLTRAQLLAAIEPLVNEVLINSPAPTDEVPVKVGVVLAALVGFLTEPMQPEDLIGLDTLARLAGSICEHRAGTPAADARVGQ